MAFVNNAFDSENIHRFSHKAMATIYELVIELDDKIYAEQAAKAAFDEIDRLEKELSRFLPNSEISLINSLKQKETIVLGEDTLKCLSQCLSLAELTNGAFDISLGRLKDNISVGNVSQINLNEKFILDNTEHSITVLTEDLDIDLGGFGKGYALDKICELLIEWEIENAFFHGGGSSVISLGRLTGLEGWPISLSNPNNPSQTILDIMLRDFSISASGIRKGDHIINPQNFEAVTERNAAWVVAESASVSDALSTAFMIMSKDEILNICENEEGIEALIIDDGKSELYKSDIVISNNFKFSKIFI